MTHIRKHKSRHITIIAGDFNAKVGERKNDKLNHQVVGKYGKGISNSNGNHLLNFSKVNNLKISNTFFKHKLSQRTTWESPNAKHKNQIDFILIKSSKGIRINDSRSFGGIVTRSDHKMVLTQFIFKWPYNKKVKRDPEINLENLNNSILKDEYQREINKRMLDKQPPENNQERWNNIKEVLSQTAKDVLGIKTNNNKYHPDPHLQQLSEKQKNIKLQINNQPHNINNDALRKQRNNILTKIHNIVKSKNNSKIDKQLEEIERTKNDSTRMFTAIKHIQKMTPKQPLLINTKEGNLTANETEQSKIIAEHFKNQFYKNDVNVTEYEATPMRDPFTSDEIQKAVNKLKNNKSAGIDNIKAEMLKNAPDTIIIEIAEILNDIAETGKYPNEITEGVITALQKPGKSKGPVENLRPITLLSMLRKILAICIRERIIERIDREIPPSQAAYRSGRSTTEHVFATKIMAERSITSTNQNMHLLMLDMSKAFDTVNRSILLKDLSKIIENDELHLISIMLNTKLRVRCRTSISEIFQTNTGVPQGDSLSANQFTFYLAKALQIENKTQNDHDYTSYNTQTRKIISLDHNYSKQQNNSINIDQEYADDISVITTNINTINYKKNSLPTILEKETLPSMRQKQKNIL